MNSDVAEAAGAGKALRNATTRLSVTRGIRPKHTNRPSLDFEMTAQGIERRLEMMTELAIEKARERGEPFRNPFLPNGERLYRVPQR